MKRIFFLIIVSILFSGCIKKVKTPTQMFNSSSGWEEINKGNIK